MCIKLKCVIVLKFHDGIAKVLNDLFVYCFRNFTRRFVYRL